MPGTKISTMRPSRTFRAPLFQTVFNRPLFPAFPDQDPLTQEMNKMISSVFGETPEFLSVEKFPALNLSEAKTEFTISAELPGMVAADVKIDYTDGVLTIRGEKTHEETKEEEDRKYYLWERRFGSFQRSIPFPGGIAEDKIFADFKDGILTVHLPKAEEAKAKSLEVPINATK
jgi:HSP20 family protein